MTRSLQENIARVEERIAAACRRSGRRREEVTLVAVSKTHPAELIRAAWEAGLRHFGENRVQEARAKRPELSGLDITWHLVGHLQSNKVRSALELFHWVDSVDSIHLAEKLAQAATSASRRLPVLLEVNLAGEASKSGARPEELIQLAGRTAALPPLALHGLMAIPPFLDNPEDTRPYFRQLRALALALEAQRLPGLARVDLSMGMSHDFEVAIEEGATIVRVGTAIFGSRPA